MQNGRHHNIVTRAKLAVYLRSNIIQKISCECALVPIFQRFCMPWCSCCRPATRGIDGSRVTAFLAVVEPMLYCVMDCLPCYCCQCPSSSYFSHTYLQTAAHLTLVASSAISIDGNFKKKISY